jgi:predicted small metal-binding protein
MWSEVKFMPSFKCKDIGLDCKFEASAKTQDELMKKIATHAASAHNMKTVPPETMTKIKKAIKK